MKYDPVGKRLSNLATSGWENSSGKTALGPALDTNGNTTTMVHSSGTTTYGWDFENRLVSAALPGSGGTAYLEHPASLQGSRDHRADVLLLEERVRRPEAGSSQTSQGTGEGEQQAEAGVASYTTNSSNEMTANSNALFTYDANGNTASKTDSSGTTNYSWDYENRLVNVSLPNSGGTIYFHYDPWGRRIYKQSPNTTSIFAYDGDNLVETVNASGGVVARYTQDLDVDAPLAMLRGTATDYYEADGLNSISSLTDTTGALGQPYTYDSFGNTTNSSGSLTNFFRYAAREFDTETNLYFYRARYYDPVGERFVSEDPARFPGGIDFYTYVENNPINLIDPFGFCPWQVHSRPLKGVPGAGPLGLDHYYFYNTQTGQSIGLGPAGGFSGSVIKGKPVPGTWERNEKPGHNVGAVPDWACNCVDKKAKNPGNPPNYCTYNGNAKPNNVNSHPTCPNCFGRVMSVLQDCYNQANAGQQ